MLPAASWAQGVTALLPTPGGPASFGQAHCCPGARVHTFTGIILPTVSQKWPGRSFVSWSSWTDCSAEWPSLGSRFLRSVFHPVFT